MQQTPACGRRACTHHDALAAAVWAHDRDQVPRQRPDRDGAPVRLEACGAWSTPSWRGQRLSGQAWVRRASSGARTPARSRCRSPPPLLRALGAPRIDASALTLELDGLYDHYRALGRAPSRVPRHAVILPPCAREQAASAAWCSQIVSAAMCSTRLRGCSPRNGRRGATRRRAAGGQAFCARRSTRSGRTTALWRAQLRQRPCPCTCTAHNHSRHTIRHTACCQGPSAGCTARSQTQASCAF